MGLKEEGLVEVELVVVEAVAAAAEAGAMWEVMGKMIGVVEGI